MSSTAGYWTNNFGQEFTTKYDAFKWLNEYRGVDMGSLNGGGAVMFCKTPFGIFDHYTQSYVKGNLPLEKYDS